MSLFADELESDEGPPEDIIRKLGAMTSDQTIRRGASTESDGKVAPKGATIYPVDINGADGKLIFKAFFFKEGEKWGVFDEAGHVFNPDTQAKRLERAPKTVRLTGAFPRSP